VPGTALHASGIAVAASQVGRAVIEAMGRTTGVTAAEGADAGPVPSAFAAVTVNVYGVPLASPVTVQASAPVVAQVAPSGAAVTT
jgi:hypothetical protein